LTPENAKILLIEGKRADRPSFYMGLTHKGFKVTCVSSGKSALTHLAKNRPHLVLLDAASMRTSGRRICKAIRQTDEFLPIILVLEKNSVSLDDFEANTVLIEPFTIQKLLNRIRPQLPADEGDLMVVGPLRLEEENRWVRCHKRHAQLTPRLVNLLKALMERPGEVIDRTELFQAVWETEYTGDTRTLDVHISWLRQALEEDPRHPRYIKTVRGVGYRLDINSKD